MAKEKCECPDDSKLQAGMSGWFDPEAELPFVTHAPGKCECTNELRQYRRGKKILTLCSCCHVFGDEPVEAAKALQPS